MKKTYEVIYNIQVCRTVEVEANTADEAIELVKNGEGTVTDESDYDSSLDISEVNESD